MIMKYISDNLSSLYVHYKMKLITVKNSTLTIVVKI